MKHYYREIKQLSSCLSTTLILLLFSTSNSVFAIGLSLQQAESIALKQSPEVRSLNATTHALAESAIAAGQLSDPKLLLGTLNVPVNTFDFSQEPMTQVLLGLQQSFPRGRSLHYHQLQKKGLSIAESNKQQVMQLQVLQGTRTSWLNLAYWIQAKSITKKQQGIFHHLLKVSESMLANNKAQQMDVIRAQLELTELENRLLEINQQIETAQTQLTRWIGPKHARGINPKQFPSWEPLSRKSELTAVIKQHPILKTDNAIIEAARANIKLAAQQYKPGFNVSAGYGIRQGRNIQDQRRPDFLTAQINLDLPVFAHNRQDRTFKASQAKLLATEENRASHYRLLREALGMQYAIWQQQQKSTILYNVKLIPEAKQYSSATMTSYQNAQTDFPTLARAYVRELDTELAGLKARFERSKARINLMYLQGK